MNPAARDEYLTTEVLTAAPQKLQLMLIESALRSGQRALSHWQDRENEAAFNALIRCQAIVSQLISGLAANLESPLVRQMSALYAYVYRGLIAAAFHHDSAKLSDALKVLEAERETWRQVCERLGTTRSDTETAPTTREANPIAPLVIDLHEAAGQTHVGFSFEA